MLWWGDSICWFVFVRSLPRWLVRSFVRKEGEGKEEEEGRREIDEEIKSHDEGKKSDDERKKKQRKGLLGKKWYS
jgi:hypothetical protein